MHRNLNMLEFKKIIIIQVRRCVPKRAKDGKQPNQGKGKGMELSRTQQSADSATYSRIKQGFELKLIFQT